MVKKTFSVTADIQDGFITVYFADHNARVCHAIKSKWEGRHFISAETYTEDNPSEPDPDTEPHIRELLVYYCFSLHKHQHGNTYPEHIYKSKKFGEFVWEVLTIDLKVGGNGKC